jgi:RimJ/RimL family protein N-acetyltransferase
MTIVRRADPADAAALVALGEAVSLEAGGWMLSTETWRSATDERRYLKAVRSHADAAVFVAVDGDDVVARLSVARDPHPASSHVADLGLMVAASHRRRGIGRALLEAAVDWARTAGVRKLELHVFPWNEPAILLYESFGFVREGYRHAHYRRGEDFVDAILMAYPVE